MVLDFSSATSMIDVYLEIANTFDALPTWQTVTTGYIKINGSDVGPINLSTATTVEDVSTIINTAAGYTLTYIRYGVNESGERVPYMVFQKSDLSGVDKSSTGDGELLWKLLGGDQLTTTSQFLSTRLQTVAL